MTPPAEDVARLGDCWDAGTLLAPHGPDGNLVDLAVALAHIGGASVELTAHATSLLRQIDRVDHVVFGNARLLRPELAP